MRNTVALCWLKKQHESQFWSHFLKLITWVLSVGLKQQNQMIAKTIFYVAESAVRGCKTGWLRVCRKTHAIPPFTNLNF